MPRRFWWVGGEADLTCVMRIRRIGAQARWPTRVLWAFVVPPLRSTRPAKSAPADPALR